MRRNVVISLITALKLWWWWVRRWSSGLSIQTGDQEVPGSIPGKTPFFPKEKKKKKKKKKKLIK